MTPTRTHPGPPWPPAVSLIGLVVVGVAVYANSTRGVFFFDDHGAVTDNRHIERLWPPIDAMTAEPDAPVAGRPVVSLTLAVNYALGGRQPFGYHVVNIAIHVLNALLLFGIVRRTLARPPLAERLADAAHPVALAAALLWLVHPLNTEVVDYVTQRTESIMALFMLLTLYAAIRAKHADKPLLWNVTAVSACALGMLSKEAMAVAPVVVLLHDWAFRDAPLRDVWRQRAGLYVGLACTWLLLAFVVVIQPRGQSVGYQFGPGPIDYLLLQGPIILHYLRLVFWPHPLLIDYGMALPRPLIETLPAVVVLAVLFVAATVLLIRRPRIGFLAVTPFLLLAPTSSVVPIVTEVGAERRMYLPLAVIVVVVVLMVRVLLKWVLEDRPRRVAWPATVCVIAAASICAALTVRRNTAYHDEIHIWQTAVDVKSNNARAHSTLADLYRQRGDLARAIEHFEAAVKLPPASAETHNNYGLALGGLGRRDDAVAMFMRAIELEPDKPAPYLNLGTELFGLGRVGEAEQAFRAALELDGDLFEAHSNLAVLLASTDRRDEAIEQFRQALRLRDDVVPTLTVYSQVLLAAPQPTGRQIAEALKWSRRAVELSGGDDPHAVSAYDAALQRSRAAPNGSP